MRSFSKIYLVVEITRCCSMLGNVRPSSVKHKTEKAVTLLPHHSFVLALTSLDLSKILHEKVLFLIKRPSNF